MEEKMIMLCKCCKEEKVSASTTKIVGLGNDFCLTCMYAFQGLIQDLIPYKDWPSVAKEYWKLIHQ